MTDKKGGGLDRAGGIVQQGGEEDINLVNRRLRERWNQQAPTPLTDSGRATPSAESPDKLVHGVTAPRGEGSGVRESVAWWRAVLDWLAGPSDSPAPAEPQPLTILEQNRYYKL